MSKKVKLSELVAELERDFQYQYNYNTELVRNNGDLTATLKDNEETIRLLRRKYGEAIDKSEKWFTMFVATWILIVASFTGWLFWCPAKPHVVREWLGQVEIVQPMPYAEDTDCGIEGSNSELRP